MAFHGPLEVTQELMYLTGFITDLKKQIDHVSVFCVFVLVSKGYYTLWQHFVVIKLEMRSQKPGLWFESFPNDMM